MKKLPLILFVLICILPQNLLASTTELPAESIENLVSPIALYPDTLLANVLPASTFPDHITDAYLLIRNKSDVELIPSQSWDESVKIIATYPGILKMMYEKLDWTTNLGLAFLNQTELVMSSIQKLRFQAQNVGNLPTNHQQKVSTEYVDSGAQVIVIEPQDPDVIYVDTYASPELYSAYAERRDYVTPLVTFGVGAVIGAAIASDSDDNNYYYNSGPWGGNIWVHDDYHDNWHDQQEFRQDRLKDRQDFSQDRLKEQQDFNNQYLKDQQQFRQDQLKDKTSKVNSNNFSEQRQAKLDQAKSNMQGKGFTTYNGSYSRGIYSSSPTYNSNSIQAAGSKKEKGVSIPNKQTSYVNNKPLRGSTSQINRSSLANKQSSYTNRASNRGAQSRSISLGGSRGFSGGGRRR